MCISRISELCALNSSGHFHCTSYIVQHTRINMNGLQKNRIVHGQLPTFTHECIDLENIISNQNRNGKSADKFI